ncbi:uncharacterized protein MEPE_04105 [Melanopsichium pennsylvanicum]|uniref:Atos-like conserved domain-containing protein n=2 Tax=Melanopsichium pennsylvanicum TaxID=63383 RepID=A0AAJ5C642_9BASI|nr:conserved hypothetical protein [Melanopsichium pennsylvanicum 4]SNX85396.1 uncharacterized protein MEPE_04105 [Melanopsichium pennsylvanicum]
MSFYSAFPSSPLSRSALQSENAVDRDTSAKVQARPVKSHGRLDSFMSPGSPRTFHFGTRTVAGAGIDRSGAAPVGPPGYTASTFSATPSARHISGPALLMRSPFGPSWSPSSITPFEDAFAISPPLHASSFTRSINTRRRSSAYSTSASSPTPNFGSLVGSFQESLFRGRMSMPASRPLIFDAEIGVLGMGRCKPSLRCPPHLHVKFPAHFYDFHAIDTPISAPNLGSTAALGSPYVGTIDLEGHYHNMLLTRRPSVLSTESVKSVSDDLADLPSFPGYAVPPKGQIQLVVKYPDLNAIKLFLVPYDLADMQPGTKTFLRQKTIVRPSSSETTSGEEGEGRNRSSTNKVRAQTQETLRFAVHLQFCCPPVKSQHEDHQTSFNGLNNWRSRSSQIVSKKSSGKCAKSSKIYLHKTVRLVFAARALDVGEKLIDQIETPGQGAHRYSTYNGPEEDWLQLYHEVKVARRSASVSKSVSLSDSTTFCNETGSFPMHPTGTGLGIAIQGPISHTTRYSPDSTDASMVPLNSDPNGERWQASVSMVSMAHDLHSQHPSNSTWSISSRESSIGRPTVDWSQAGPPKQDSTHQLVCSFASSRLSDSAEPASSAATEAETPISASTAPRSRSPLPPMRPSRIRSASAASHSEARVQSVSALGRLEESAQTNSTSADLRRPTNKADHDRPSLFRKLSEQLTRRHEPSPTGSPKLRPTWRQTEDELAEMIVNPTEAESRYAVEITQQHVTRSIR